MTSFLPDRAQSGNLWSDPIAIDCMFYLFKQVMSSLVRKKAGPMNRLFVVGQHGNRNNLVQQDWGGMGSGSSGWLKTLGAGGGKEPIEMQGTKPWEWQEKPKLWPLMSTVRLGTGAGGTHHMQGGFPHRCVNSKSL